MWINECRRPWPDTELGLNGVDRDLKQTAFEDMEVHARLHPQL